MTRAPAAASASAVARPIPRDAPVTRAVLLARLVMMAFSMRLVRAVLRWCRKMLRQAPASLAELVDTVRVEGDVILDLRHRFKWRLIRPHRVERTIPASRNAVVGSVALVGTIRGVFTTRERGHIDITTGDILNRRIGRLAKRQRIQGIGDNFSADCDHDARRIRIGRNGVVGPRNLDRLVSHGLYPSDLEMAPQHPKIASRRRRTAQDIGTAT